ncbi:MAG: SUMF1/EgtB/PvdO family nonheme iron enzyme [Mariprofundaceae bacterium]|nr:SUMF1/EgtB/PvdO family nonheme iron enzyme [Mariprofundaceae bacterium]
MNASKSTEKENSSDGNIERMHAELLRAKARQRRLYMLVAVTLFCGTFFTLAVIVFSNGTAIEIHPEAAKDSAVIRVLGGFGAAIGNSAYSLRGKPTIAVAAEGFKPLRKTLLASETGGTVAVTLAELPSNLRVTTKPESDKTRWFTDGKMLVIAKSLQQALFSGEHRIDIDSPYYQKKTFSVAMQRGKTLTRSVDLEPLSGQLNINTVPVGASIRINGKTVGISPVSLAKEGGLYQIEVTYDDYQTIIEDVEITNTEIIVKRDYRLALKDAYVNVRTSPANGILLLNGKKVPSTGVLTVQARKKITFTYSKRGHFSQSRSFSLAPGITKDISFQLKPEIGVVDMRSMPKATVVVDGKTMGRTPLVLKLSALPHRIELRRNGYRTYKKTVTPSRQSTQKINAVLRTELQARLAESPREFTNSIGMALKLFKPNNTFVMGAPRYEKGQRANEFLRTVRLTRPFYAGKYEVSIGQFAKFKQRQGARNNPVSSLSWIEAAQFCNWLSLREKLTPFYRIRNGQLHGANISADGYRLLSEAEWEWLARKAAKPTQSKFTWGDDTTIPANAGNIADESAKGKTTHYVPNYSDSHAGIAPIGSYPAEKTGLYDLTGNVSEWVHDVYSLIPPVGQTTESEPLGAQTGDTHTVKGSNWRSGTVTELRASYREGAKTGRDDIGFRIARYVYGGTVYGKTINGKTDARNETAGN